jgi:cathepsin L
MKVFVAFALLFAFAAAISEREYQSRFVDWMHQNKRTYNHEEFRTRYQNFKANLIYIDNFNAQSQTSMKLGMNQFGDLSNQEFQKLYLSGLKVNNQPFVATASPVKPMQASFDWRTKGAVTPIKNQGQCGSCWAFSTTGSTEGCHQISTGTLVSLSEQNLVDCSTSQGNQGCNGGLMTDAMTYIIQNGGIDTEASYAYTAEDGTCHYSASDSGATLKSYTNVQAGSESDLQAKVTMGPTSVAIDASQSSFQFYTSGVYYEPNCSSQNLDHGVLAVGWGEESNADYWIVKNSWGTGWGEEGYILMSRNRNNNCGIATMATLPVC